jgi:hypothetical protein
MFSLTLTITPGRSGSTFAAAALRASFPGRDISHERLGPASTLPRTFFHAYHGARKQSLARHSPVVKFMDAVEAELNRGPVVTTGKFTSHLVPVLADRFPGRLRIIGLFRHPLITAASFFVRGRYHGWPAWSIGDLGLLTPFDSGILATSFRDRWATMSPFEKCLYYWAEYVLLWREVRQRYPHLPALQVASEDLFKHPQQWLQTIASFAGLEGALTMEDVPRNELNLKGSLRYPLRDLWRQYLRHPEIFELSACMGYRLDDRELEQTMRRYQPPDSIAYRLLFAARWYHIRGYVGYRVRPRFWRDHWAAWQAQRALKQHLPIQSS